MKEASGKLEIGKQSKKSGNRVKNKEKAKNRTSLRLSSFRKNVTKGLLFFDLLRSLCVLVYYKENH